jgi:hypothetical protein
MLQKHRLSKLQCHHRVAQTNCVSIVLMLKHVNGVLMINVSRNCDFDSEIVVKIQHSHPTIAAGFCHPNSLECPAVCYYQILFIFLFVTKSFHSKDIRNPNHQQRTMSDCNNNFCFTNNTRIQIFYKFCHFNQTINTFIYSLIII